MDDPTPTPTDLRRLLLAIADEIRDEKEGYVQLWGVDEAELRWLASHLPEMMRARELTRLVAAFDDACHGLEIADAWGRDAAVIAYDNASSALRAAASPLLQGKDRR